MDIFCVSALISDTFIIAFINDYIRIFKFQALHKHHTCVYLCAHVCVWACVRVCVCHVVRRLRTILSKAARHKHPLDAAHWHNASRAQNYTQHHVCVHGYT